MTKEEEVVLRLEVSRMVVNFTLFNPLKEPNYHSIFCICSIHTWDNITFQVNI